MKTIVVYGSLKKGKYNHTILKDQVFVGNTTVIGTLYSVSTYPALLDEGDNEYPAEIYQVDDEIYQWVHDMEIGAGYVEKETPDGIVYYAGEDLAEYCRNNRQVINGY